MPILKHLFLLVFVFTTHQSVAELLVDTGTATGTTLIVISGNMGTNRNFAAAQVEFTSPVHIQDISTFMLLQAQQDPMTVSIMNDVDGAPGGGELASVSSTQQGVFFVRWYDFEGFDVSLDPGSYWITLTVDDSSRFDSALLLDPPLPLENYAVLTEDTGQWSPADPGIGFSIRVEGEELLLDTDGDDIDDIDDNCTLVNNPAQRDTDGDGYGNYCDPDLNNDNIVNFLDIVLWSPEFDTKGNGDTDFNGDGLVNFLDYVQFPGFFLGPPGPSGLNP